MAERRQASVIRRKTRAAREGTDPRALSPVRELRLALARAADKLLNLALIVSTVEQRRVEAGEVEAVLGTEGLFLLLDGPEGARAAMRFCPGFVAALVEVQTTGRVRPGEPRPRPPTRTDAAMAAPLVEALLSGFDDGMAESAVEHPSRGFHFGDRVEDARALSLLLAAPAFELFRLTADLGPGLRTARLDLLLPPAPASPVRDPDPTTGHEHRGTEARDAEDLTAVALAAPVALDAVLARIHLPLWAAMALEAGQRLEFAKNSLDKVNLVGAGGHVAAEGRLGRHDGWRALRLAGTGRNERFGGSGRREDTTGAGANGAAQGAPPDRANGPPEAAMTPKVAGTTGSASTGPPEGAGGGGGAAESAAQTGVSLAPASD